MKIPQRSPQHRNIKVAPLKLAGFLVTGFSAISPFFFLFLKALEIFQILITFSIFYKRRVLELRKSKVVKIHIEFQQFSKFTPTRSPH